MPGGEFIAEVGPAVGRVAFFQEVIAVDVRIAGEGCAGFVDVRPVDVDVPRDQEAIELQIHRERVARDDRAVAQLRPHVAVGRDDVAIAVVVDHVGM